LLGSPTILVDGADPCAGPGEAPSWSCRVFATDHGIDGAPTVDQLIEVLAR
jgi:hypothetical protein